MTDLNLDEYYNRKNYNSLDDDLSGIAEKISRFFNRRINAPEDACNIFNNLCSCPKKSLYELLDLALPSKAENENIERMYKKIVSGDTDGLKQLYFGTIPGQFLFEGDGSVPFISDHKLIAYCIGFFRCYLKDIIPLEIPSDQKDTASVKDFLNKVYNELPQKTQGIFCIPTFGEKRVKSGRYRKVSFDFMRLLFSSAICRTLMNEFLDMTFNSFLDELKRNEIACYSDFYELWFRVTEENIIKNSNSDEWCKAASNRDNDYSRYLIDSKKIYESSLSNIPVFLESDARELSRTVYEMQKEIVSLKIKLEKYERLLSYPPVNSR